jgi:hypothetical protein
MILLAKQSWAWEKTRRHVKPFCIADGRNLGYGTLRGQTRGWYRSKGHKAEVEEKAVHHLCTARLNLPV